MAIFRYFLLSIVSSAVIFGEETCNVETGVGTRESVFDFPDFSSQTELLNIIDPVQIINDEIRLVEIDSYGGGGVAGSFWFNEKQRIGDGFVVDFQFKIGGEPCDSNNKALSDGFAFVTQNDKINNIEGSVGSNLGFKAGLKKYFAVGFDLCADRQTSLDCTENKVIFGQQDETNPAEDLLEVPFNLDVKDCQEHSVRISYLVDDAKMKVYIDDMNTAVAIHNVTTQLEELWGDNFAYFGFTASNLDQVPANIDITSFKLDQLIAGSRISTGLFTDVEFGNRHSFVLTLVDTCNSPAGQDPLITAANITAELSNPDDNKLLIGTVIDNGDGSFIIFFDMPNNVVGTWDLEVRVNGVLAQDMPVSSAIETVIPKTEGLTEQELILVACLVAVLVIITVYAIHRFYRYKKKLDANKDNIEMGKVAVEIREIDQKVTYSMNPLLGTLDEMKEKLEKNMKILEKYKTGETMDDPNYTIDKLQEENAKLRAEMNRLKKEEQEQEALSNGRRKQKAKKARNKRNTFAQDEA